MAFYVLHNVLHKVLRLLACNIVSVFSCWNVLIVIFFSVYMYNRI